MINYNEKGPGLHDAIRAAGHWLREENGVWVASSDEAVQAIIDNYDPLLDMRAKLHATVAAMRIEKQKAGAPYTFPDGLAGTIQTRNDQDIANVNGQTTAALILQSQGVVEPVLEFRDEQNVTHVMTPEQMIAMGMSVSAFVKATYAAKWKHDAAIDAWDGSTPYDVAQFWSEA